MAAILPDSYRHHTHPRLHNRFINDVTPTFALSPVDVSEAEPLAGTYFYLDSEWPQHFGHVMTEQLSRVWAWEDAKKLYPDLKGLIALPEGKTQLAAIQATIFEAAGIDRADLVTFSRAVTVERLLTATPMLVNPDYVHPEITAIWGRTGRTLEGMAPEREYPVRFFSSRRPKYKRRCHNVQDVEQAFARHGFEVVYPEDYTVPEQAAMFRRADVVAGFAGSALFSLSLCESPKKVIMISSESYTARNEYMIASVPGPRYRSVLVRGRPQAAGCGLGRQGVRVAVHVRFLARRSAPREVAFQLLTRFRWVPTP